MKSVLKLFTYKEARLRTTIEIPFKAVCPIPDPPRYYHATLTLSYSSHRVFDYDEVASVIHSYCKEANRSVEDVVRFAMSLIRNFLGDVASFCTVDVPQQEGHLHVTVTLYGHECV